MPLNVTCVILKCPQGLHLSSMHKRSHRSSNIRIRFLLHESLMWMSSPSSVKNRFSLFSFLNKRNETCIRILFLCLCGKMEQDKSDPEMPTQQFQRYGTELILVQYFYSKCAPSMQHKIIQFGVIILFSIQIVFQSKISALFSNSIYSKISVIRFDTWMYE